MRSQFSQFWKLQLAGGAFCLALAASARGQVPDSAAFRLRFVAASRQIGPVGYRDPLGVMSPDGQWLAYTSGGWLRVTLIAGGPARALGPRSSRVLSIGWLPDSRRVAAFQEDSAGNTGWWQYDVANGERRAMWSRPLPKASAGNDSIAVDPRQFRQLAWAPNAGRVAGIAPQQNGFLLWTADADGSHGRVQVSTAPMSFPVWAPDGSNVACLLAPQGVQHVSFPCGGPSAPGARPAYGAIAFSPDGSKLYFGSPNERGTLDLWMQPVAGGAPTRLSNFARDSYAPSVARDGRVLFGTQDYRVFVAVIPSEGGAVRQLTAFQSETPSWSRDDRTIAFTFGSWRRIVDDLHYPDIAQDLGVVRADVAAPAVAPLAVIRASPSEDQALDWSPNGRWIVLHSHADGLDDLWIQPANGSAPARPITKGGIETGWPRWSPDGAWIAYSTQVREGFRLRGALFVLGVDSATGGVTHEARRIPITGTDGDIDAAEWVTSDSTVFLASEGLDRRAIYIVARQGGRARLVHRFTSEQNFSGLGVSPGSRWVVFVAPAADGYFQLFRVPISGGTATQLTFDPTDKTQPSVSHDGKSIAFTVFSYQMQFWLIEP